MKSKLEILGIIIVLFNFLSCVRTKPSDKPNVILIITDDQGYGDISFNGNKWINTPNIDQLAMESCRLNDFHSGTTCAPTRSGLMTGRYCNRVGVWHTIMGRSLLRKNEVCMAEIFRNNGYRTGMFGKWHLGDNYPYRPHDRGFDEAFYHGGGGIGQTPDYWDNDYFDDTYFRNGSPEKVTGYCTDVWFRNAIYFITENKDGPFFCYLSTNAPHGPFHVAQEYIDMYKNNSKIINPNFYGMITNIDENIGLLREKLEQLGIAENTILIFMTDNGTSAGCELDNADFVTMGYNAGMRGKKGSEYNGGHRVPVFIHWETGGIDSGHDVDQLTAYTDILPTLIDLCDLQSPDIKFDGVSLMSSIYGNNSDLEDRIIITDTQREEIPVKWKNCAIMTNKFHLIRGKELYNMDSDPGQTRDIAKQHPEIVKQLQMAYEEWWDDISVDYDDYCEIIINPEEENPTCLTAHDWHSKDRPPWNQDRIRTGLDGSGYWVLDVKTAGSYEFALRRWPIETGLSLNADLPQSNPVSGGKPSPAGISIQNIKATIRAGEVEQTKIVEPDAQDIRFTFDLNPGEFKLQTWFEDINGIERGAYYTYVRQVY